MINSHLFMLLARASLTAEAAAPRRVFSLKAPPPVDEPRILSAPAKGPEPNNRKGRRSKWGRR